MNVSDKIESVDKISKVDFERNFLNPQKPLVIKNLAMNTKAYEKWSLNYFKETMGHVMVDVFDNNNAKSSASAFTRPDLKMRFDEYLSHITHDEQNNLRIFLFDLFKKNPELRKEFPCPDLFKGLLDSLGYMFFGGKNTTVRIHYDIDMSNVLHTHFGGRKRVVLVSPEYSDMLYRLPLNTYSLIDPDKPDYSKYPALRLVKAQEVILNHGETIFMPSGWWHYMTYLDESFSVSYRKMTSSIKNQTQGLLNLAVYMPTDKVLNKLYGEEWLNKKKRMAEFRALEALNQRTSRNWAGGSA